MEKEKLEQLLSLLEDIPLYKWEQLKIIIDREFKSQVNTIQFQKRDTFVKNTIQELSE